MNYPVHIVGIGRAQEMDMRPANSHISSGFAPKILYLGSKFQSGIRCTNTVLLDVFKNILSGHCPCCLSRGSCGTPRSVEVVDAEVLIGVLSASSSIESVGFPASCHVPSSRYDHLRSQSWLQWRFWTQRQFSGSCNCLQRKR